MAKKNLIGVWEPEFAGVHINDMTEEQLDEFAEWLASQVSDE